MKKTLLRLFVSMLLAGGCSSTHFSKTVSDVDMKRFMKKWYVIAGRFTFLEKGAHNAVEIYKYNSSESRIDIDFRFNENSFSGPLKKIPQKAWVVDAGSNSHWKVSPFWPLKFDYLVIALAKDYSWTAIGVPNEKYLWIMADQWNIDDTKLKEIIHQVQVTGYPTNNIVRIPQSW